MSDKNNGTALQEMTPEKVDQWRSTVRRFFSTSWAEVQKVIEALETELDEPEQAPPPGDAPSAQPQPAWSQPTKADTPPAPSSRNDDATTPSAPSKTRRPSSTAPARSGSAQDERLAELARRIEERLRQSKT